MLPRQIVTCFALIAVKCYGYTHASYESDADASSSIGSGTYSAGFVGNYAGHLSGGKAISELQLSQHEGHAEAQHDFSESAAEHGDSHYETLGGLGDHLGEHNFPKDFGAEHYHHEESAHASDHHEEETAATGHEYHHADLEEALGKDDHYSANYINKYDFGDHDFDTKPVPGIDHGKGAFSYSSTYEFKDPK